MPFSCYLGDMVYAEGGYYLAMMVRLRIVVKSVINTVHMYISQERIPVETERQTTYVYVKELSIKQFYVYFHVIFFHRLSTAE